MAQSDATDAQEIEEKRASNPITEVVVTRHEDGDECLYVGDIDPRSESMLQIWDAEDGNGKEHRRYMIEDRVQTPSAMTSKEVWEWIESSPEALQVALEHDLEDDINDYPGIGIKEFWSKQ